MRCYVTHELTERFAEHRDQCWAVDDGRALIRRSDHGGGDEAQRNSDCSAQSAFGAGEHAAELSPFHSAFPLHLWHRISDGGIASVRWNVM